MKQLRYFEDQLWRRANTRHGYPNNCSENSETPANANRHNQGPNRDSPTHPTRIDALTDCFLLGTWKESGLPSGGAKRAGWWAMQGLNLRPLPCEGSALPLS